MDSRDAGFAQLDGAAVIINDKDRAGLINGDAACAAIRELGLINHSRLAAIRLKIDENISNRRGESGLPLTARTASACRPAAIIK